MRKSFQEIYTELQDITSDDSASRLTIFKRHINDTQSQVYSYAPWPFLETTDMVDTVASQQSYQIPAFIRKLTEVKVTVSSTVYRPKPVEDTRYWEYLNSLQISDSDVAQFYYREGRKVYLWPTPASAGSTITFRGRKTTKALSLDDYTTGSIAAATNGDETITGGSTSWATGSVGNWIRVDYTNGDFRWYEISSITSTTELELVKPYEGTTFTGQSETYTIGEFSEIPGEYHNLLFYRPLALYYMGLEDLTMANQYWVLYDGGKEAGLSNRTGGLLGNMMDEELEKVEGMELEPHEVDEPSLQDLAIDNTSYTGESW